MNKEVKNYLRVPRKLIIILIPFLLISCEKDEVEKGIDKYVYIVPEVIDDGWEVASLDTSSDKIKNLLAVVDEIEANEYTEIHSLLIVYKKKLVFETYFPGHNSNGELINFTRNTLHEVQSASKSFRSALVGIAIDKGFISGEDVKLFSFFPEYSNLNNEQKENITLEHILTMSSGLNWHEWDYAYGDSLNPLTAMYQLPYAQWTNYVLSRPMEFEPGSTWAYSTGASIMLNDIIIHSIDISFSSFVSQYYSSLIESNSLPGVGNPLGGATIPRDLAKLGYLFINEGRWKQKQVISKEWIDKSIVTSFNLWNNEGYGYQWWIRTFTTSTGTYNAFYASGNGGQYIVVVKELDLVIVFTGGNFNSGAGMVQPFTIIENYVLPAFESSND